MTLAHLDNLVKTNNLKTEPADQKEFDGMVISAKRRLQDANVESLSDDSRFSLAYGAAHALSLASMRWHGYRSDNRYLVFQCLEHTVGMTTSKWRVLDKCHKQRNLAEYEGHLEITPQLLDELIAITNELLTLVEELGPIVK
ncbi:MULTISPECIES: hypothetical protein [unclassified Methylophaga]|mgnify:FL=1|jgi:hypothetical protein|uniref:hypothetical protein n=1 Tax=unclassified Methylophaga TaxID=2629249 RepID=UPI000C475774|nr:MULTISPECIES: hypothetical protein [unclassified Methylophaga]MAP25864.1 hypothetical protein [Methylophaga sp.]MBP25214.1 hypothetical protein [Methylophaga sp.]HAD32413.1 hypothetical protein [Methylophaga sp.]HBX59911.1 hypothetical protein [Methylophaga sp.]HCO00230.1 hypothetical protein [Methylophaga sp.]|tara:strand:- start:159 stop:584 length:426 start_codon:yes stop_codon:yes gene_type:complete